MSKLKLFTSAAIVLVLSIYLLVRQMVSHEIKSRYASFEALANVHAGVQNIKTVYSEGPTALKADTIVTLGPSNAPENSLNFTVSSEFSFIPGYEKGLYFLKTTSSFKPTKETKKSFEKSLESIPKLTIDSRSYINGKQTMVLRLGPLNSKLESKPILPKGLSISSVMRTDRWAYAIVRVPSLFIESEDQKIVAENLQAAYQASEKRGLNNLKTKISADRLAIEDRNSKVEFGKGEIALSIRNISQGAFEIFDDIGPKEYQSLLLSLDDTIVGIVSKIFEQSKQMQLSLASKLTSASEISPTKGVRSITGFSDRWHAKRSTVGFDIQYRLDMDSWINETADIQLGKSYARLDISDISIENPSYLNQALASPSIWSMNAFSPELNAKFKVGLDNEKALAGGVISNRSKKNSIPAFQTMPPYKAKLHIKIAEQLSNIIPENYLQHFSYQKGLFSLAFEIENGIAKLNRKPLGMQSFSSKRLLSH